MAYKGNGNKTAEKVYKRLYTKLPLNCAVPAGQFTSTSEGDFNHPTLGYRTEFQWAGIRSYSDQDTSPRPVLPTNTTLLVVVIQCSCIVRVCVCVV